MNWPKTLKSKVRLNEPLAGRTTFKIGGPAKYFAHPCDIRDLKLLLKSAKGYKIPHLVIGCGSNLLVSDRGLDALVIKLDSPAFKKISFSADSVRAGSGVAIRKLIDSSLRKNLSGLEFLAGIPGTLGGALLMNAGAWGQETGDLVEKIKVMDYNGRIKSLSRKDIKFGYRKSSLGKFIILEAVLKLIKKDKKTISAAVKDNLELRLRSQDYTCPSAGSIFKNPPGEAAGRLIEACGLKGARIGDACVSRKHANFILNKGNARASDILKLIRLIQAKVRDKFGIRLEPEIKIWS